MGAAIISYVSLSLWLLQEKDNLDVVEVNASIKFLKGLVNAARTKDTHILYFVMSSRDISITSCQTEQV